MSTLLPPPCLGGLTIHTHLGSSDQLRTAHIKAVSIFPLAPILWVLYNFVLRIQVLDIIIQHGIEGSSKDYWFRGVGCVRLLSKVEGSSCTHPTLRDQEFLLLKINHVVFVLLHVHFFIVYLMNILPIISLTWFGANIQRKTYARDWTVQNHYTMYFSTSEKTYFLLKPGLYLPRLCRSSKTRRFFTRRW